MVVLGWTPLSQKPIPRPVAQILEFICIKNTLYIMNSLKKTTTFLLEEKKSIEILYFFLFFHPIPNKVLPFFCVLENSSYFSVVLLQTPFYCHFFHVRCLKKSFCNIVFTCKNKNLFTRYSPPFFSKNPKTHFNRIASQDRRVFRLSRWHEVH